MTRSVDWKTDQENSHLSKENRFSTTNSAAELYDAASFTRSQSQLHLLAAAAEEGAKLLTGRFSGEPGGKVCLSYTTKKAVNIHSLDAGNKLFLACLQDKYEKE